MNQPVNAAASADEGMLTNDQRFLLTVIFGTYFGPHLKGERPPLKSATQRVYEGLPQYTPDQLAGSKLMVAQMMHAYYYILRKASQSVIVAPPLLIKFFCNTLPARMLGPGSNYPQFIDCFPTDLHPFSHVEERFMAIDNIIFIDNPSTSYLREEVVARFKTLTGLQEFVLEKDAAKLPIYVTDEVFHQVVAREAHSAGQPRFFVPPRDSHGRQCNISMAFSPLRTTEMQCRGADATCCAGVGVVWNAEVGLAGSITVRVTVAESEDSYLFNVSLPGVRSDPRSFLVDVAALRCEFNMDGKVLIEGEIATGGNMVQSRTGNLCPPGHFSFCFQLPSRVNPKRSNCKFVTDGTIEGIVKKLV
ncbi:hypothetical protein BT93_H1241 [Corymbia citriodora subsp. variegata]|nr:hypothetical protein BT93_H1241 [Corymbia citriodora subsp. variegata]